MKGYIHSTESFGSVDGPGVRFVIFVSGCPMRCQFCHNPDTWSMKTGTQMSADELLDKAWKYRSYWGKSGGITVSGGEPLLQIDFLLELFKKAKEKGIRITYIDSYTKEELQDLTVATDNVNAGRMLGEYARKLIDKDSKIAIVSHVKGVSTAVEREQGFREGLGDYADNIVDIVYCNSLYEKSYELAQELMRKYPDLELIAGMNEYSAVGVGRAVSDAGAKDKIAVVGVDCSQEAINLMEMGVYKGIIVQKAFRMGYIGVEETIHMLNGDAVEKNIDSGCELVTPENMYNSDIERLIFPFS